MFIPPNKISGYSVFQSLKFWWQIFYKRSFKMYDLRYFEATSSRSFNILDSLETYRLQVKNTVLRLDSPSEGCTSFISSVLSLKKHSIKGRIITTEETTRLLNFSKKKNPDFLICPYNQPFMLGNLKLELLPSGGVLGGASLYIEKKNSSSILYAPLLQEHKTNALRQIELREAATLILGAHLADPKKTSPASRKKELEKLAEVVKHELELKRSPIILCNPLTCAHEITQFLDSKNIPVAVHKKIFKFHKLYESYGFSLGSFSLYNEASKEGKAILMPLDTRSKETIYQMMKNPVIIVENTHTPKKYFIENFLKTIEHRFSLSSTTSAQGIQKIIEQVKPHRILFLGPYAKKYVKDIKASSIPTHALSLEGQPTLF